MPVPAILCLPSGAEGRGHPPREAPAVRFPRPIIWFPLVEAAPGKDRRQLTAPYCTTLAANREIEPGWGQRHPVDITPQGASQIPSLVVHPEAVLPQGIGLPEILPPTYGSPTRHLTKRPISAMIAREAPGWGADEPRSMEAGSWPRGGPLLADAVPFTARGTLPRPPPSRHSCESMASAATSSGTLSRHSGVSSTRPTSRSKRLNRSWAQ